VWSLRLTGLGAPPFSREPIGPPLRPNNRLKTSVVGGGHPVSHFRADTADIDTSVSKYRTYGADIEGLDATLATLGIGGALTGSRTAVVPRGAGPRSTPPSMQWQPV
jgi:hypothetical protein